MRPLTQGVFSEAQVLARLADPNVTIGSRLDILDRDGNLIDALFDRADGMLVEGAEVDFNVDSDIKSHFRCRMRPHEALRSKPFTRLLRPVFILKMGPRSSVSWPLGEYVWTSPDRDVWPGDEWWDVTCADKTHLLDLGGPGRAGHRVEARTIVSDAINLVLRLAGFPSDERVPRLDERVPKNMVWGLTTPRTIKKWQSQYQKAVAAARPAPSTVPGVKPKPSKRNIKMAKLARRLSSVLSTYDLENAPTTWLKVVNDLLDAVGYNSIWFDYDGKPQVGPPKDLTTATADFTFRASDDGTVISRIGTSTDYSRLANRVLVRPKNEDKMGVVEVDGNVWFPKHPLVEARIGVYADTTIDDDLGLSVQSMRAQGRKRLQESLGAYELVRFDALAHPGLEMFDVVGLQVPDDPEFSSAATLHVRQHGFDLAEGTMTVEARRVFVG